jgi:hypothetical protein
MLRSKHSGWTWEGKRTPFMGGGGGGGPSSTTTTGTTYQTNIPEYAQPYVETMLGATQKQLFDMEGNEITGFKPYKPYSTNVNDYVAGFSPLQQQAMQATGQLGVPSQYGQATQMTGMAGLGSLGLAGQMAGAGQDFAQQAQDPMAMQGYMSPYMQNVVDYQKSQAARDYNIGQGVRKAQAVGQGAFGGSRQAIMESEAQRSLMNQMQGIAATGSQKAFEDAQRQQQFGAQLGMQGRQAAMQGLGQFGAMGAQLGQLGGQELAARQGIIQSQYGMGQQQQAMEQQKINQAMQDWANTQQYPLMQLGVMSNMLRGLPMQASTTNQYQAAPNALTQGIGAAGAGASLYNALRGASGGLPKEFKSTTGIKSYYEGDVVESTKADLYDLSLEELEKRAKSSPSPTIKRLASAIAKEKRMGLAGGGIIAFANPNEENNQSLVKEVPEVDKGKKLLGDYLDTNPRTPSNVPPKEPILPSSYSESKKDFPLVKEPGQDVRNLRDSFTNLKMPSLSSYEKGIKAAKQPKPEEATPELVELSAPYPVSDMRTKDQIIADANKQNARVQADPNLSKEDKAAIQRRTDEGIAIVKADPNIGVKPPAAAPAGIKTVAPTDAKIPGGSIAAEYGLERPAEDRYAKMSISDIAKEKLAFLGPDVRKEERAGLMAERANAKDEARRAQSLRFAEFFADWGSRPGSTIVAGLNALKEKVPSIVSDSRKEAEIRRAINKDIAGLDKADRLEKAGAWDEAAKLKNELGKEGRITYGNELNFLSARLSDKSKASSAIEVAKIGQTNKENVASTKDLRFYEEEISKLEKNRTEITSGKESPYVIDQKFIDRNKDKAAKGELSEKQKSAYDAAVARKKTEDDKYNNRRAELIAERDRLKGTPAPVTKTELPPGAIPGSKQIGTSNGVPVYEAPDGKRYTLK